MSHSTPIITKTSWPSFNRTKNWGLLEGFVTTCAMVNFSGCGVLEIASGAHSSCFGVSAMRTLVDLSLRKEELRMQSLRQWRGCMDGKPNRFRTSPCIITGALG